MSVAASAIAPTGVSVWLLVAFGALVVAMIMGYWFVSARDTLDRLDTVLPTRSVDEDEDEGRDERESA